MSDHTPVSDSYEHSLGEIAKLRNRDAARNPFIFFLVGAGLALGCFAPLAVNGSSWIIITVLISISGLIYAIVCSSAGSRPTQAMLTVLVIYAAIAGVVLLISLAAIWPFFVGCLIGGVAAAARGVANA